MLVLGGKLANHDAQRGQRGIGMASLLKSGFRCPRLSSPLGASKVHEIQLRHPDTVFLIRLRISVGRLESDTKDRVGPGGPLVHVRTADLAVLVTLHHVLQDLGRIRCDLFRQSRYRHVRALNLEIRTTRIAEEVPDLLVVYFQVGNADQEFAVGFLGMRKN